MLEAQYGIYTFVMLSLNVAKTKQICFNLKLKIIEMYLSDLPPAPWNKFPIPCS